MEATAKGRELHWKNWCAFVAPVGVDPELQETPFQTSTRIITGFSGLSRTGYYGRGKRIQSATVSSALTAVDKKISLAHNVNPTKLQGGKEFIPRIQEILEGWYKEDPPTLNKLPVEVDVPEWVTNQAAKSDSTELRKVGAPAHTLQLFKIVFQSYVFSGIFHLCD